MCGRYAQYTRRLTFAKLAGLPVDPDKPSGETSPSWSITPGTACTLIRSPLDRAPEMVNLYWGLIPHWIAERPARAPINAKIETAATNGMFRRIFRYRRCLVAADGWYEWRAEGGKKQPYFHCFADHRPFFFGGVWDEWQGPCGNVPTFAILTRPALPAIADIHDRMPVIVQPEHYAAWLDKTWSDPEGIASLAEPPDAGQLIVYPVSTAVNRAGTRDGPDLIEPLPVVPTSG